jgi:NADPH2:quinone reductase
MQGWSVAKHGRPEDVLRWGRLPDPTTGSEGLVVRVAAVGLNFADTLSVQGRYQIKAPLPFTPGIECAGTVERAADGLSDWVGRRVLVGCPWGAMAELVAVRPQWCFELPDGVDFRHAAALLLTYQTAWFALRHRTSVRPGEWLLVHNGAGGVGSAAIQLGKAAGARIVATAGSPEKLKVCLRAGADHVIDYRNQSFREIALELTQGRGVDVVYDSVGGEVFEESLRCLASEGRLLVIGFAGGRIPDVAANRILLKNISVIGLNWGMYRDQGSDLLAQAHKEILEMYREKSIDPILYGEYRLQDLPRAMADLAARSSYGKLVLQS